MSGKDLRFGNEARALMLKGVDQLADAVQARGAQTCCPRWRWRAAVALPRRTGSYLHAMRLTAARRSAATERAGSVCVCVGLCARAPHGRSLSPRTRPLHYSPEERPRQMPTRPIDSARLGPTVHTSRLPPLVLSARSATHAWESSARTRARARGRRTGLGGRRSQHRRQPSIPYLHLTYTLHIPYIYPPSLCTGRAFARARRRHPPPPTSPPTGNHRAYPTRHAPCGTPHVARPMRLATDNHGHAPR